MGSTCISGMLCKETPDRKMIARTRWESLCPPETWDVYNSLVKWGIRQCVRFSGGGCCRWLNDVQISPAVSTVRLNIHILSGTLCYSSKYSGYSRLYDPFRWQLTSPVILDSFSGMLSIMSWESWETPQWPIIDALGFKKKIKWKIRMIESVKYVLSFQSMLGPLTWVATVRFTVSKLIR